MRRYKNAARHRHSYPGMHGDPACLPQLLRRLCVCVCVCVCSLAVRWITPLTRNLPLLFPLSLNMGMPQIPARALPLARPALGGEPGPQ
jgi:hypothetical protein